MWRSRMFWQLFGTYGVLILFSVGLLGFVVGSQAERSELAEIEDSLRSKTAYLEEVIRGREVAEYAALFERLSKRSHDLPTRITFIAADGKVIAESGRDPAELDNHGDRPEVMQARLDGFGKAVRHSATLG